MAWTLRVPDAAVPPLSGSRNAGKLQPVLMRYHPACVPTRADALSLATDLGIGVPLELVAMRMAILSADAAAGVANFPWRNSRPHPARKALRQWQTRNDKRMLAVMTADRPGTMLNDVRTSNQA